ncbi:hypothetical protein SAMN05444277_102155 [Parafilimonas terrae]|uniref:Uncharacterized protein n=1 Tax=Parafilimonas terrae TaxID=1465490 RepID=A0A1I5TKT1_9BACT|nr:hypothetical protein SAMN05444277_102155 [Parafilimonas terrae]
MAKQLIVRTNFCLTSGWFKTIYATLAVRE